MFPFYMGINETKYAWMDEGWATIGEWLISPMIDSSLVDEYGVAPYAMNADMEADLPIMTLSTQINGTTYFLNSYPKPAFGYLYIKDLLGDAVFTKALHHYIRQWQGKHPVPYDFFNCMNAGAGRNLNWFWKRWFFDSGFPDLGIGAASKKGNSYQVTVNLKGSKPLPVDLTIEYRDGSTGNIHRTVSVSEKCYSKLVLSIPFLKQLKGFRLGSSHVPDVDPSDNVFTVK
jgi:aminopeptidase N